MARTHAYTPDDLKAKAEEYFAWCEKTPIRGTRQVVKDNGEVVTKDYQYPRPYTVEGFMIYSGITNWTEFKKHAVGKEGYAEVIDYIQARIRQCQVEGGMVGIYKENLTARLNGIADHMNVQETPPPNIVDIFAKRG